MIFLATAGLAEFYGLVERRNLVCFKWCGLFGGVLLMVGTFLHLTGHLGIYIHHRGRTISNGLHHFIRARFVRAAICFAQQYGGNSGDFHDVVCELMYVPWLLNFIQKINFFPGVDGKFYVLYFIIVTKFSDTGAYAVGSLVGRSK